MTKWKAPRGWRLVKHDGYTINHLGMRIDKHTRPDRTRLMPDGQVEVVHFDEDEPFYPDTHANGIEGYSPRASLKPIQDGVVPPVYTLHQKEA